ncbi:MAG: hypothetical protein ACRD3O_07415, partial [Terriglobia bacterium]
MNTTGTYLTTTNVYGSNGLVTSTTDPKGNTTTYGYSGSYAGSGPTSVKNALGQTTTNSYDFNTGLLTSTTDPNNQTTSYSHDNMLRTTQINSPDGGETAFTYPNANDVDISEKISSSASRLSYVKVDGVGREIRQAVTNGEAVPYNETDTCYDGNGRANFKSYAFQDSGPFATARNCASPELGDSFAYDALGRARTVTHSDGPAISTSYSGNSTTVTDEAGKTRESFTDGLGRLEEVIENPGGLNYATTYAYDALDDLTGVVQNGSHQRTFVYDSLSRLTSSANPESGAISYTYDSDGNVVTRTDARGITATYTYDALNRVTQKTYSDGTPSAFFYYDAPNGWGYSQTNMVGRISEEWTGTSCCATGGAETFSYDPMGRVIDDIQWQPSGAYTANYTYDLLGDMTSYPSGSGAEVYTQNINAAGLPTQITASWYDPNHPATLVSNVHYNA